MEREKECCQKELKEIPKRYTNVLQGDAFLVEGLMSTQATKLRKLELSEKKHILVELIFFLMAVIMLLKYILVKQQFMIKIMKL